MTLDNVHSYSTLNSWVLSAAINQYEYCGASILNANIPELCENLIDVTTFVPNPYTKYEIDINYDNMKPYIYEQIINDPKYKGFEWKVKTITISAKHHKRAKIDDVLNIFHTCPLPKSGHTFHINYIDGSFDSAARFIKSFRFNQYSIYIAFIHLHINIPLTNDISNTAIQIANLSTKLSYRSGNKPYPNCQVTFYLQCKTQRQQLIDGFKGILNIQFKLKDNTVARE